MVCPIPQGDRNYGTFAPRRFQQTASPIFRGRPSRWTIGQHTSSQGNAVVTILSKIIESGQCLSRLQLVKGETFFETQCMLFCSAVISTQRCGISLQPFIEQVYYLRRPKAHKAVITHLLRSRQIHVSKWTALLERQGLVLVWRSTVRETDRITDCISFVNAQSYYA